MRKLLVLGMSLVGLFGCSGSGASEAGATSDDITNKPTVATIAQCNERWDFEVADSTQEVLDYLNGWRACIAANTDALVPRLQRSINSNGMRSEVLSAKAAIAGYRDVDLCEVCAPQVGSSLAMPKSSTTTRSLVRNTFCGFTSRCTMPRACAASSACATGTITRAASRSGSGPRERRACKVSPTKSSCTKHGPRSTVSATTSNVRTAFGCKKLRVMFASRRKRRRSSGSKLREIFSAT